MLLRDTLLCEDDAARYPAADAAGVRTENVAARYPPDAAV